MPPAATAPAQDVCGSYDCTSVAATNKPPAVALSFVLQPRLLLMLLLTPWSFVNCH